MAVLSWAVICERSIIEQGTNNMSLIALVEVVKITPPPSNFQINQKNPPIVPHRFSVVQRWTRSQLDKPETPVVRSRLIRPDGKEFGTAIQQLPLDKFQNAQFATQSPGFPYAGAGEYSVQLQIKTGARWKTVKTIGFTVILDESATPKSPTQH